MSHFIRRINLPGAYLISICFSDSSVGLSIAKEENESPQAPKKSFPKNGKPGRFARAIILKSGWSFISASGPSDITRPSGRRMCFDSRSDRRVEVTWVGALSASSIIRTWPATQAENIY